MKYTRSVVLMTALVPTIGHKALVDFALSMSNEVVLIISSRSFEPVSGKDRIEAFKREFELYVNLQLLHIFSHEDDNAPQNPSTEAEWNYWKNTVENCLDYSDTQGLDYFIASEPYGKKMADLLHAEFIPFDIERAIVPVKGTRVRSHIEENWKDIMPAFRHNLLTKVVIFGQESTGKTTMTRRLGAVFSASFTPEFARPYLEAMDDKTTTDEKMEVIVDGQFALQVAAHENSRAAVVFHDTDLYSTIGYYDIYSNGIPKDSEIEAFAQYLKSDLYIVMHDGIPFEKDELRYGGEKRESSRSFWIDILEKYGCNYYVVKNTDPGKQLTELVDVVDELMSEKYRSIETFVRD